MTGAHQRHEIDLHTRGPAYLVIRSAKARGVIDQDIDATQLLCCVFNPAFDGGSIGEITSCREDFVAVLLEALSRLIERALRARADRHVRTGRSQTVRNGKPDASTATRHKRAFTC